MILDLTLIALVIALEPIPLTTCILLIASRNGSRKGAAFVFGWLLSLAVVVAATVLLTGNQPPKPNTAPSLAALAVKMLVGVGLLVIALRKWRTLGKPRKPKKTPKWQAGMDSMSLWFALALGPLTQPWGLVAAGVAVITGAKLTSAASFVALFVFCLVGTSTYLLMELFAVLRPAKCQAMLAALKQWIDGHTDQMIVFGSLILGFWLVGKSIYLVVT